MDKGFLITIRSQPKHGALYAAAMDCGGVKALAEKMKCSSPSVGNWINLREYPRSIFKGGYAQRRERIAKSVQDATGLTLDECWPVELREFIDKTQHLKSLIFEQTKEVPLPRLTRAVAEQLTYESNMTANSECAEARQKINKVLKTLSYREREIIKLRYGLNDSPCYTLEEVAHIFKVNRERVRQIEAKAVRKLQCPHRANELASLLD